MVQTVRKFTIEYVDRYGATKRQYVFGKDEEDAKKVLKMARPGVRRINYIAAVKKKHDI